jgi:hypothetical protein
MKENTPLLGEGLYFVDLGRFVYITMQCWLNRTLRWETFVRKTYRQFSDFTLTTTVSKGRFGNLFISSKFQNVGSSLDQFAQDRKVRSEFYFLFLSHSFFFLHSVPFLFLIYFILCSSHVTLLDSYNFLSECTVMGRDAERSPKDNLSIVDEPYILGRPPPPPTTQKS